MQHLSEAVFVVMCDIVGTSQQLVIRRETSDIREEVDRRLTPNDGFLQMLSGSRREGFRLTESDVDCMFWKNNHRVITDVSQSEYYNTANTVLILSDSSVSPPGFTLLQLLTPSRNSDVNSARFRMNDRLYISSSVYKQLACSLFRSFFTTEHGPCISGVRGEKEYDNAFCFACDFWPSSASLWIDRCHSWPNPEVVDDIVRNGCHFVAIGHPLGPHENEEWRISFSQAEYKLVYSMNHSQFLTYGLLKLFLKEVINQQLQESNKLLCSYHMKTTIFWAIQHDTLTHWCPQNLLAGFWICFKLLLKWVYKGICPNFFIPQNNLFLTKIHGSAQNTLFLRLNELYRKGLACVLQSSSIRSTIIDVLYNPRLSICTYEHIMISEAKYDAELITESRNCMRLRIYLSDFCRIIEVINTIEQLIESPLSHNQFVVLQNLTTSILQQTSFLQNMNTYTYANKQKYNVDKLSCHMLKLATKFGCISDMIYIAMYFRETSRYREALSVIVMTKVKLAQPYVVFNDLSEKLYTEAVGGQPWSTKIRHALAEQIELINDIRFISELIPEQQAAAANDLFALNIPVFVMFYFLEFLCYRHIDTTLSQAALNDLQVLVHCDRGQYIFRNYRDISWEILGICQQITGNLQSALYSYQQSLKQYPWNNIQTATQRRIQEIVQSTQH
ncbi:uncharacterized protein LOC128175559 [Crassostrea angulata]|uniref:uncharacterized protein LOC128175559 n=1 Tax=Magallana angulata TaxID=2784310 RepID=UPI0022B0BDFE|nr:uncharacterized protein LOC128175559 [Crassostrea angulata]